VVYYLPSNQCSGGSSKGVAFVEAGDKAHASYVFKQQYAGQYSKVMFSEKLNVVKPFRRLNGVI